MGLLSDNKTVLELMVISCYFFIIVATSAKVSGYVHALVSLT